MTLKNTTSLMQYENANFIITLNEVTNNNKSISKLDSPELLPTFKVTLSGGNSLSVQNGYLSKVTQIPKSSIFTAQLNNQSFTFTTLSNPSKIINNKNIVKDYDSKVTFKVRVKGYDGKIVGKNEVVTMKIAGKTYGVKTNGKGYASKTLSLTPGKYKITTIYKGFKVKNTITIKNVLKAKSKTVKKAKKIKYSASLKTSAGKAIKGKKIAFKIKGKTYSAKTDKKGVATVIFKNLKVGKYSITVKYLKSQVKTTLKVKK